MGRRPKSPVGHEYEGEEIVRTNIYLPRSIHLRLKYYALDQGDLSIAVAAQKILIEFLQTYGQQAVAPAPPHHPPMSAD